MRRQARQHSPGSRLGAGTGPQDESNRCATDAHARARAWASRSFSIAGCKTSASKCRSAAAASSSPAGCRTEAAQTTAFKAANDKVPALSRRGRSGAGAARASGEVRASARVGTTAEVCVCVCVYRRHMGPTAQAHHLEGDAWFQKLWPHVLPRHAASPPQAIAPRLRGASGSSAPT